VQRQEHAPIRQNKTESLAKALATGIAGEGAAAQVGHRVEAWITAEDVTVVLQGSRRFHSPAQ